MIPRPGYGGGTVIVRDRGTHEPLSHDPAGRPAGFAEPLRRGHHPTFRLNGSALRGDCA
ncbi:hypothetical protein [Streptomyces sp. bgisy032]|uniref:hypothetical protein n=1 Tax=Streptomyces sp. bgisy032 TaxID=3413773 RepID=UPI003D75F0EA